MSLLSEFLRKFCNGCLAVSLAVEVSRGRFFEMVYSSLWSTGQASASLRAVGLETAAAVSRARTAAQTLVIRRHAVRGVAGSQRWGRAKNNTNNNEYYAFSPKKFWVEYLATLSPCVQKNTKRMVRAASPSFTLLLLFASDRRSQRRRARGRRHRGAGNSGLCGIY